MLLVVDVGNTQTHLGAYRGEELLHDWRFATVRESTADELGARLRNLLALRDLGSPTSTPSILSSTVPQLRPEWTAMVARYLGHEMPVSARACGPGCRSAWTTRARSARTGWSTPSRPTSGSAGACVIVDFGTAITYDIVSEEGEYVGGIIGPGVEISIEALTSAPPRSRASTSPRRAR